MEDDVLDAAGLALLIAPEQPKPLDAIWRDPSGGVVYVGSLQAAADEELLRDHGITHVVTAGNFPWRKFGQSRCSALRHPHGPPFLV